VGAALYNLGMAYRSIARPQDAAEAFTAALAIEAKVGISASEGFRRVAKELARLERDRGQPVRAVEIYKAAIEALPALPDDETYQLWGVIGDQVISLGVLGHNPEIELFSAGAPVSQLVVTIEQAGGVVSNGNPDGAYAGTVG
jgi:anti-sigma-K factor RskA